MSSRIEEQDFTAEKVDLTIWKRLYALHFSTVRC